MSDEVDITYFQKYNEKSNNIINYSFSKIFKMSYYAYTSDNNNYISMYSVNSSNGNWTPLSPSTIDLRNIVNNVRGIPNLMSININNINYVYVVFYTYDNYSYIITYYVNSSNGQLVYVSNYKNYTVSPTYDYPLSMSIIKINSNYYLYVSNALANTLSMFSINSTNGVITPLSPSTIADINNGQQSYINTINTSNGNYAYVTNNAGTSNISMYSISISGQLVPLSPSSITSIIGGVNNFIYIATINNQNYAYILNNYSNNLAMYSISVSGQLVPFMPSSTISTGTNPYSIITPTVNGTTYAYVTNGNSNTVSMYSISASGELIPLSPSTIATDANGNPQSIVSTVINSTTYVYVANYNTNKISMYSISTSGGLVPLSPSTVATDTNGNPSYISIATVNNTKYAYVTNYTTNTVSMYSISNSGILSPLSPSTVATDTNGNPSCIVTTTINSTNYAYMTNYSTNTVSMYSISNSGGMVPLSPFTVTIPYAYTSSCMTITNIGGISYVYVVSQADDYTSFISVFSISISGELIYLSNLSITDGVYQPQTITIITINNTQYAYVIDSNSNTNTNVVYMYSIANDGSLTPLFHPYVFTAYSAYSLSITTINNSIYAYVVNQSDNNVSMFSIDSNTGMMNLFSTVTTGNNSNSIAMTTTTQGNYLYVTNTGDNTISMYSISSNGSLVPLSPYVLGGLTKPQYITISTINNTKYAYVSNINIDYGRYISIYSISDNGQLIALTPINTVGSIYSIAIVNIPPVPLLSGNFLLSGNYIFKRLNN